MAGYKFGKTSNGKLASCCQEIRLVANRAIVLSPFDITIIWGWRGEEIQNALFVSGASTKPWGESKHNIVDVQGDPYSEALDFGPWVNGKIPWDDTHIFAIIAGCFFAAAKEQGIEIRYGGDWDGDGSTKDQTLMDWGHVEVIV